MNSRRFGGVLLGILVVLTFAPVAAAQDLQGELFDTVVKTLREGFYDKEFREEQLPEIAERFRGAAHAAIDPEAERHVIHALLAEIPASHLQLLSQSSYQSMFSHLLNKPVTTMGFEVIELDGMHFVHALLEGSPAAKAGVLMGDRVISINGDPIEDTGRLDWRTDDAALPDAPIRALHCEDGEEISVLLGRTPEEQLSVNYTVSPYSAFVAAGKSAVVYERADRKIGYLHLHYIHMTGPDTLLIEAMNDELRECDALILDLRGRGGNAFMVGKVVQVLSRLKARRGTVVLGLIDQNTRSAKEAIAWELRDRKLATLVGESTPGALLPATFAELGHGAVLMFPAFKLPKYSDLIEGIGVPPHVNVEPKRAYTNGRDPLIEEALSEAIRLIKGAEEHDPQEAAVAG